MKQNSLKRRFLFVAF